MMEGERQLHVTIQRGKSLPDVEKCSKCCQLYHCPFCKPDVFKPTKLSKVKLHLDLHFTRAVMHGEYTVHRCGLECRQQQHYHCLYCAARILRKADFIKHLSSCPKSRHLAMAFRPSTPPVVPEKMAPTTVLERALRAALGEIADAQLPLSSLCLLVPPVRLMSACMWQVAQQRNAEQYGKLVDFITLVTEMVPEIQSPKQRAQLILGLRARLILELLQRMDPLDSQVIQDHLNCIQLWTTNYIEEEGQDSEVEVSKSAFVELVQTLIDDPSEKEQFFKDVFPVQYGARFDTTLQILVWEFLSRLEEFLPVPSFSEVASSCDLALLDPEMEQFVSDPEDDLRTLLQHRKGQQKLTKSQFSFMSDTILSTLASKPTCMSSKDQVEHTMDMRDVKSQEHQESNSTLEDAHAETDEDTDHASMEAVGSNSELQGEGLSPVTSSVHCEEAGVATDSEMSADMAFQESTCLKTPTTLSKKVAAQSTEFSAEDRNLSESRVTDSAGDGAYNSLPYSGMPKDSSAKGTKRHSCLECGKSFKGLSDLKRHQTVHSEVKLFPCNLCEKGFKSKCALKRHLQNHTGYRPHVCSYCDRSFTKPDILKAHIRIHTGERPFACTLCEKRFIQKNILTAHLRWHRREKPYLCSECGKAFGDLSQFVVHSRQHTGERPYHCDFCGKNYITSHRLKMHQRYHTGERPFSCKNCEKSFHTMSGLKKHIRTHTGEKPFQCTKCGKRFSERSNMKVHQRSHR
ncbi:uncharacterized protein ACJ7VT_010072 isoform 1-T1 [Polymixia lowei]